MMDKKEENEAKDFSAKALCIALGFAVGGVLFVPVSKFLPEAFQTSLEVNGQFGDFIGGLLNPVIALLAFVWLRKGVISQQSELEATKKALVQSEAHQGNQVKIAAMTALISSLNEEYAHLRDRKLSIEPELQELIEAHEVEQSQMEPHHTISPNEYTSSLLMEVEALGVAMKQVLEEKLGYLAELKEIVKGGPA